MKKLFIYICGFFIFINFTFAETTSALNSPEGYWQTIDDVTGKPKAIVQIEKLPNQTLIAHILKIYPRPGVDQNALCKACEGDKHNQRIVGMQIMENLQQNKEKKDAWINGKILDPNNGKIYNCNIQLVENNQKLRVRGYLGIPLFGRSQTWVRVENQS